MIASSRPQNSECFASFAGWWRIALSGVVIVILAASALPAFAAGVAPDEKRVALVVGISKYQFAPPLPNPDNDARRMAEALRRVKFEVEELYDPDYRTLARALRAFGLRAQKADAALVFYAGHGVQVDHDNYIIPADAKLEREHDLLYEALSLDLFLGEVSQAKKVGILLLDACRNNPFVERMSRSYSMAGRAAGVQKGLARVDKVPRNTIVAMATRADEIAEDGDGENSPFTQAVLAHLQIPGLELSLFFRSVRDTVLKATNYHQEPYVFSSLGAEPFYFYPRPPNRPPVVGAIAELQVTDVAGPTPLGIPRPTDPDDDPLTVRVIGLPRSGEIRLDGKVAAPNDVVSLEKFMTATYKSDGKSLGRVGTFDFLVEDGRGANAMGSLPITVTSSNHPPVVEPERTVRIFPGAFGIAQPTDPDGDRLTVTITALPSRGVVRNGTAAIKNGDQLRPQDLTTLTYTADPGATGDVGMLRYTVDDGRGGIAEGRLKIQVAELDESSDLVSGGKLSQQLLEKGRPDEIQSFLSLFPGSRHAEELRQRQQELIASGAPGGGSVGAGQPPATAAATKPVSETNASPPPPSPAPASEPARVATAPPAEAAPAAPGTSDPQRKTSDTRVAAAGAIAPPKAGRGDQATFQDCPTCPVMVKIPGGSFMMGQASDDPSAAPAHKVTLHPFAIGQHAITVAEWKACTVDGGCAFTPRMVKADDSTPVHNISWDDAQRYVAWLSQKSGHRYRLPSEAEWEYAARGNTTTRYWWGNDVGMALANCRDCGGNQDRSGPLPVESFKPNPFGLYDVHGGVAQWVADCWFPNYKGAASDGSARDQKNCQQRVLRGGSFRTDRNGITAAARNYYDASVRYIEHGLRVAAD
jgi:formylglycine-generating enzyme required for sulfatase activity